MLSLKKADTRSSLFSNFKRHTSVKNHRTGTKFKLNLYISMTHQYIKFELNVCNGSGDNDRKVNDRRKEGTR